jgi:membrane-associated protease RseP (regulator of RpoE activity)
MNGYIKIRRRAFDGITFHFHWSVLLAAGLLFGLYVRHVGYALLAVVAYFAIILLHEIGHALMARRLGCRPTDIYMTFMHGLCVYESGHDDYDAQQATKREASIAWAGVLMQLLVALPLIALHSFTALGENACFIIIAVFLGYASVVVAIINLIPVAPLDGHLAWRLFPILIREARTRRLARQATRNAMRRKN